MQLGVLYYETSVRTQRTNATSVIMHSLIYTRLNLGFSLTVLERSLTYALKHHAFGPSGVGVIDILPKEVEHTESQDTWRNTHLFFHKQNTPKGATTDNRMTRRWWQRFPPSTLSEQEVCD